MRRDSTRCGADLQVRGRPSGATLVGPRLVTLRRSRRVDGFPYLGPYRYLVTFCTTGRRRIFIDAIPVSLALRRIKETAVQQSFSVIAYSVMPDHIHLLVEGTSDAADLRRFVKMMKQRIGYALHQEFGL